MIAFLDGVVAGRSTTAVCLDVHGVGYEINMGQADLARMPEIGQKARVFTYLQVREDGVSLFGFATLEEKTLFLQLISVSGVGPKVALSALSVYSPAQLIEAIAAQDVARVSKIPGVGKKTAQRIILELKGTIDIAQGLFEDVAAAGSAGDPLGQGGAWACATDALLSMGFTQAEAELALKGASVDADEAALLQYALKKLGSL